MASAQFTPSTPSTPHPRLISKMAVAAWYPEGGGSIGHDAHDGVVVSLFCKVNIKKGGYARHLLFPDENITLLSTLAYPLESPQNALLLNPPPPIPIQEAAQRLNIPTTIQPSNPQSTSSKTSGRSQKVKIVIQDFSVCLISEGGEVKGDSSKPVSRPTEVGANEEVSKAWLIMLEFLVPLKSRPPLDRYSISIPLPRCLSNTLSFQLQGPSSSPEESDSTYSFLTTPRLLPGPSTSTVGIHRIDRMLEGTFQSTTSLEIRWAPQQIIPNESSGSISVGGGIIRPVALRSTQQKTFYNVLGEEREDDLVKVNIEWELTSEVHYSGVENTGHLDLSVDAPSGLIWKDLPLLQANRGLSSSSILVPQPLAESDPTEISSQLENSFVVSPSPSSNMLRIPNPPFSKTSRPRIGSGESSSHPSLLRQQPPSSVDLGDGVDASFSAFDISLRPSPSNSPVAKHRSPLGNPPLSRPCASAESTGGHQPKVFRLNLDISQIHASRQPFIVNVVGTVLLKPSATGEIILPEFAIEVDSSGSEADLKLREWSIKAPKQAKVYPPPVVERILDRTEGKAWRTSSLADHEASYRFVVGLPVLTSGNSISETNLPIVSANISPVRSVRRKSSLFVRQPSPPAETISPASLSAQPSSNDTLTSSAGSRSILSVHLDTFLSVDSVQEGNSNLWNQLSKMKILLSPFTSSMSSHEEDVFFEFGIISRPSASSKASSLALNKPPLVRIISVHVDGVSLPFTLQKDSALDSSSDAVVGALGYIRVELDDETREAGGLLEVLYAVSGLGSSANGLQLDERGSRFKWGSQLAKVKASEEFQLGLPSFENEVKWEEIIVHVANEYSLSINAKSSSSSFFDSSLPKNVIRSVAHSLPALATPHLSVIPFHKPPPTLKSTSTSIKPPFSWSRLPFLLLTFWLLFSIGSEIRTLRSGMIDMAVEMRGKNEMIQQALERCETGYQRPLSAWQSSFASSSSSSSSTSPPSSSQHSLLVPTDHVASSFSITGSSPSSPSDTISPVPSDTTSSVTQYSSSPPSSSTKDYIPTQFRADHSLLRPSFVDIPPPVIHPPSSSSTHSSNSLSPTSSYSFTTFDQFLSYTKKLVSQDALNRRLAALRQLARRVLSRIIGE